jgi:hypothetical protein
MSYEPKTIQVTVIGAQGGLKRIECKANQNYAILKDGTVISFKLKYVRPVWCPSLFNSKWKQGIMWRAGTLEAIDPDVTDNFVPLLSQADTNQYIITQIANASGSNKKMIETWQFWALLIGIIGIAVLCALMLFGVHFNASTTTTVIHNINQTNPTATPIILR